MVEREHTSGGKGRGGRRGGGAGGGLAVDSGQFNCSVGGKIRKLSDMHSSGDGGEGDGCAAEAAANWLCPSAKLQSLDSCWPPTTSDDGRRQRQRPCSGCQRLTQTVYVIKCFSMSQ